MSERQKKKLAQREANRLKRRMIEKVRSSNDAFNLNLLVDGWLELESDPGTFSLLIEDFGCFGAQVDEIYDLEQKFEAPIFGFIFLFKWANDQQNDRSRSQKFTSTISNSIDNNVNDLTPEQNQWSYVEDEKLVSEIFFAKQMISNSCATHALISILLNCDYHELNLGPTLTRLKEHTKVMDPENKGYAIGNLPELAKAHNSHASYSSLYNRNKLSSHSSSGMSYMISGNQRTNLQQQNKHEAYHFVSYMPINNRLYELDGLKNHPIDHGPFDPKEDWTEKFRSVIKQRLLANKTNDSSAISNEIRYNLMAVVPDKRVRLRAGLKKLKQNHKIVNDSIQQLTKRVFSPLTVDVDIPNPPYSPLSNGTLTASESGSAYNSPTRMDDGFSDSDEKVDKFFFIKFDQSVETTPNKEENTEPAHKNCIIDVESTNLQPIDLKVDSESIKKTLEEADTKLLSNNNNLSNNRNDQNNQNNRRLEVSEVIVNNNMEKVKEKDCLQVNSCDVTEAPKPILETKVNGTEDTSIKINDRTAHNNEMYNLSTKPPFDFNILDDMQHVHFGKSTLKDMKTLSNRLSSEIIRLESSLKEEIDKRRKYKIDNSRRTHNYEPFIMTFLSLLAKQGNLADLIEKDLGIISEEPPASQVIDTACKAPKLSTANTATSKITIPNGSIQSKANNSNGQKASITPKPKYKYVSTGRPVGRPRKNPLVPPPVKTPNAK